MTQSKAEAYGVAKREFSVFLDSAGAGSRSLQNWSYPAPTDATIEAERATILALANSIRQSLLVIDTRLNILYDIELP